MKEKLLIELLEAERKYAEHLAKTWDEHPPEETDKADNDYEIAFKRGYATGLSRAINLIKEYLVEDHAN